MSKPKTILIIDDNRGVLSALKLLLKGTFEHIIALPSPVTLPSVLRMENPDVVLLDMNFTDALNSGNEGLYWLHEIKRMHPSLPVVLFTAYGDIDLAVRGIKEGATDFVVKPWDNAKLVETLKNACSSASRRGKKKEERTPSAMYWGASAPMRELRAIVEKVATTDANVLITGENGTGKEMLAREIHALSNRFRRDMVTVDMGAVTETLFESELFGHKKGAFTDAHTDRAGKFEAAHESTIFLDEIGNLPYHLQSKLLTVLQSRSVVRVGTNHPIPVDVRLICATNANLDERVALRKVPRGLALPHQHHPLGDTAIEGAQGRHYPPGRAFHRALRQAIQQGGDDPLRRCQAEAEGASVVWQHPRAGACSRKGGYHQRGCNHQLHPLSLPEEEPLACPGIGSRDFGRDGAGHDSQGHRQARRESLGSSGAVGHHPTDAL